jgi:hypothetical protein
LDEETRMIRSAAAILLALLSVTATPAVGDSLSVSDFLIVRIENSEYESIDGYIGSIDARREMTTQFLRRVGERPRLLILNAYFPPMGDRRSLGELVREIRARTRTVSLSWGLHEGKIEYSVIGTDNTGYLYFGLGADRVFFLTSDITDNSYVEIDDRGTLPAKWIPLVHLVLEKLDVAFERTEDLEISFDDLVHVRTISYSEATSRPEELDGKITILGREQTSYTEEHGDFVYEIHGETYAQEELIISSIIELANRAAASQIERPRQAGAQLTR